MQMYEVGGCVRDGILGIPSKDIDFSVVLTPAEQVHISNNGLDPFKFMVHELMAKQFHIFVETPEFLTVIGRFPSDHPVFPSMAADFVLARQDGTYGDGRRPDVVVPGTLMDDLARRDFTMNAIAKDADGNLIDPFGGQEDIERRLIRAVGDARQRIVVEDALRGLRAIRFSITKGFDIGISVWEVLDSDEFRLALRSISTERIQGELDKAFRVNTPATIRLLTQLRLVDTIFGRDRLHLVTSMKGK